MRLLVLPSSVALCAALAVGARAGASAPQTQSTTQNTTRNTTKKKKAVAPKTTAKTAAKTTSSVKRSLAAKSSTAQKRPPVVARRAPQAPSTERLKEIQQALADKGYFNGEPDGAWGQGSVTALKHFQHDQKLAEDGKIGSLSLIALGLGPKREPPAEPEQKIP